MLATLHRTPVLQRCGTGTAADCPCHRAQRLVSRYPSERASTVGVAPAVVHDALRSAGRPIDPAARARAEAHFGRDFSHIRVHEGSEAAEAARAVSARAFTVGRDVVFGRGEYAPGTREGMALLSHELTHTVQQEAVAPLQELKVSSPDDPAEREADQLSRSLDQSGVASQRGDQFAITSAPAQISRFAEAEEEVETEEEVDLELENYERYGIPPHGLAGLSEVLARENERRGTVNWYERPTATLDPGGKPPDFVTVDGEGQVMTANGTYTFRRRSFHVLEAIRFGVSRATTEKDLEALATTFFGYVGRPGKRPEFYTFPTVLVEVPSYPQGFDPEAERRLDTYQEALDLRVKTVPALSKSRLAVLGKKRKTKKGCIERAVPPAGENLNPMANLFASQACRLSSYADFEWEVTTPTGMRITYDGKIGNVVYECKCGYEGIIDDLISGVAWREARANRRLSNDFDEQMRRQQRIASECGFGYRYMVSSSRLANLLRHRWPDVFLDEYPWYDTCN